VSLRKRLERLEDDRGGPCAGCGWRPEEIPPVVVVWDSDREPGSVLCAACGRYLVVDWPELGERYSTLAKLRGEGDS
jgi:hypothetical protein